MTKPLFISFFLLLVFNLKAQNLKEEAIIGKWTVKSVKYIVDNIPQERKKIAEELRKAMLNSTYEFSKDHIFYFDSPNTEMKAMLNKKHWKFNPANNTIYVQEFRDKEKAKPLIMELTVKKEGDKVYFLSDMPVIIEVEREI